MALEKEQYQIQEQIVTEKFQIVLHNDEVHTFDEVIDALMKYCNHTAEQATQCTYLVHYKGKCEVKTGALKDLSGPCEALIGRGLSAEITFG